MSACDEMAKACLFDDFLCARCDGHEAARGWLQAHPEVAEDFSALGALIDEIRSEHRLTAELQ